MATTMPVARKFHRAQLAASVVFLGVGFASIAWTRLSIAIILPEVMKGIGVSSLVVGGLISTLTVLGTGVSEPFMGRLADVLNRRLLLTLGLALFSLFSLLTAFATNLPSMMAVRIVLGIGQGIYIPCYVAFIGGAFGTRRGLAVAIATSLFTVGNAIDPLFTRAVFQAAGNVWQAPFVTYGIIGLILALGVFALGHGRLYEIGRTRKAEVTPESEAAAVAAGKAGVLSKGMILLLITMFCWGLSQYGYLGLLVTFLRQQQHFSLANAALVLSIAGWASFGTSFLTGWISDHIGRRNMMLISGTIGLIVSYPLFVLSGSFWSAVILAAVFQSANGHFFPLGVAYGQDMAREHQLGGHSGAVSGIGHIMAGLSGLVAGSVASLGGFTAVGWEFTLLMAVMVGCIYLTVDPVHRLRLAERHEAGLALA